MSDDTIARLNAAFEGRYRIQRELGSGGMATVYLADDLKHGRKVAVKVLKPELAAVIGGERFIAEIRTTAQLQHPHILPLFDSGAADGFLYYVMPYVEGESLRHRLDRERQLDVVDAVHIAGAVASALQYAHDRGVIHRDIKPANILLHAGEPLVADFGIALAVSAAGGGRLTETGLSLGTPHYMSPEQASADRDLSARSDLYSLACVLYEMLAGQPPHTGPSAQSILVRILTEEPRPLSDLRQSAPRHLAAAVSKGLEKLPADRFRSADELRKALDDPSFTHARGAAEAVPVAGPGDEGGPRARFRGLRTSAHWAVTGLLAVATAWLAMGDSSEDTSAPLISFVAQERMPAPNFLMVEVGADGTVAFAPRGAIMVRRPEAVEATPLVDADWGEFGFSPDGQEIVYAPEYPPRSLWRIPVYGGTAVNVLVEQGQVVGGPVWGDDGWIYFNVGGLLPMRPELHRVREVGGAAERLLAVPGSALTPSALLPGGRALVYTQLDAAGGDPRVMLLNLESRDTTELVGAGSQARWSPTGHLVYGHPSGALWASPFDLDGLRLTGPPVPVQGGVRVGRWWTHYGMNRSGTLAYITGWGRELWSFHLVDEDGNRETLPIEPSDHYDIDISPDGRSAAYTRDDDIRIIDLDRGSDVALTEGRTGQHNPAWSPDGSRIVYQSGVDLRVRPVDLSTEPRTLEGTSPGAFSPTEWLEDGTIVFGTEADDVGAVRIDGDEPVRMLLQADWIENGPSVSPDGRWLAYVSDRHGSLQVYVRSWPGLEGETRISSGEVEVSPEYMIPQWSPDSRTLHYVEDRQLIAADVRAGEGLVVESRRTIPGPLTESGKLVGSHPDGRLLIAEAEGSAGAAEFDASSRLIVVTNWFTRLKERMGEN